MDVYFYVYIYINKYDHVYKYMTSFWEETPPHPWELEVDSTWVRHDLLGDRLELRIWVRHTETENAERRFFIVEDLLGVL